MAARSPSRRPAQPHVGKPAKNVLTCTDDTQARRSSAVVLDPNRRPGLEPARLLPPPRPPRRQAPPSRPETVALPTAASTRPLDPRATQTLAPPARALALGQRRDQRLARGHSTTRADLTTTTTHPDDHERNLARRVEPGARPEGRTPTLPTNRKP